MTPIDSRILHEWSARLTTTDVVRILDCFADDVARLAGDLDAAVSAGDAAARRAAAHGLAGAAAAIGAHGLERAARAGLAQGDFCPADLVARIRAEGELAVRALQALCPYTPVSSATERRAAAAE